MRLAIAADGAVTVTDGCVTYGGTLVPGRDGEIVRLALTGDLYCVYSEGAFLPDIRFVAARDGRLIVSNRDGAEVAVLERNPESDAVAVQTESGSVLLAFADPQDGGDGAEIDGILTRSERGCLVLQSGQERWPVVFPHGTRLLPGRDGADVPGIGVVGLGDRMSGGGGYGFSSTAASQCALSEAAWMYVAG